VDLVKDAFVLARRHDVVRRSGARHKVSGVDSKAPALDKPSSRRWKYTSPAYGCQPATAARTPA
jgi:hypothetical protein